MKKTILVVFLLLITMCGCDSMMNTPTKRVEEFLNKYQRQDNEILTQLDTVINEGNYSFTSDQSDEYKDLMKKQYKDLTYTIKEETIDGNDAMVEVEIEVYDFNKTINESEEFYLANPDSPDFKGESGEFDSSKYMDYKIKKLKETKDRIKYTLNLTLSKSDKEWLLNNITEADRQKIHGLYNS